MSESPAEQLDANLAALNDKQRAFVFEYCVDFNGTQAAIRAGYSSNSAGEQAYDLLKKPQIKGAIATILKARGDSNEVLAQRVRDELTGIAFFDPGEMLDFSGTTVRLRPANQIPRRARKAISSIKVRRYVEGHGDDAMEVEVTEIRFNSKNDALQQLGKHLGMFIDRQEVTGKDGGPITVKDVAVARPGLPVPVEKGNGPAAPDAAAK